MLNNSKTTKLINKTDRMITMPEAFLLEYVTTTFTIGGGGPDKRFSTPSKAVYIPSEKILVKPDREIDFISGPMHIMYKTLEGYEADVEYSKLLRDIKNAKPRKIKVSRPFIEWAEALKKVKEPREDITKLLDPFRKTGRRLRH
jgi:hypothetical protein